VEPGTTLVGRFEIECLAKAGGMGAVYRARDRLTGERVAIKIANAAGRDFLDRLDREARVLADLHHPAIVRYVAHGETRNGDPFLAMEWLEGIDLADRLVAGRLSIHDTLALGQRVAEGLAAAHALGLVHRDIKPSNLFLPDADVRRVKLLDFGIVRDVHAQAHSTVTGLPIGTPGYMAPEQARGSRDQDPRADLFSFGCVLFECLTGRPPFVGHDMVAVQAKILFEEAPRLSILRSGAPHALEALIATLLAKDPTERPASSAQVASVLSSTDDDAPERRSHPDRASFLTTGEQRLVSVIALRTEPTDDTELDPALGKTLTPDHAAPVEAYRAIAASCGGVAEQLGDGSVFVTIYGRATATELAHRAVRCAWSLRELSPTATIALAMGRAVVGGQLLVGEIIDRATRLIDRSRARQMRSSARRIGPPILMDDLTGGLLDDNFDVVGSGGEFELHGVRERVQGSRTLLGRPSPCVGRAKELGMLETIVEQCLDEGAAQAVVIEGEEGIGKSRLRYEFVRRVQARGDTVDIWVSRGDPMSGGAPFGFLVQAVRRAIGIADGEALGVRQTKLRSRVSRHVPQAERDRVTHFLGELIGVEFEDARDPQLRAARRDPILMGDQMRRAAEDWVAAELAYNPLILILEDLHWGDLPSVQFFDSLLRNLRDRPLFILALARPEIERQFPALWSARGATRMRLTELTDRACRTLVRSSLGDDVAPAVADAIVQRAAGNAFYLEELIRAAAAGRNEELPDTVLAMVQARIERLPPEARRLLRCASVFGETFWRGGVHALMGHADPAHVDEWLRHLLDAEVIATRSTASFPGEDEYIFRHALLREAAYRMLTEADRSLGHRLAGEWLERIGATNPAALAEHFERGLLPERAIEWYARGAEDALAGNEYAAVQLRGERAISCGATEETLGRIRMLQADASRWSGRYERSIEQARDALSHLPPATPNWFEAAGTLAIVCSLVGNRSELVAVTEELNHVAQKAQNVDPAVVALARATSSAARLGMRELANETLRRMDDVAAGSHPGDPAVAARLHYSRASVADINRDVSRSIRENLAAAEAYEAAGMLRNLAVHRRLIAEAWMQIGRFEPAEQALRRSIADSERLGLRENMCFSQHLLAVVLARRGLLEEAVSLGRAAVADSCDHGGRNESHARCSLAAILLLAGDAAAAHDEAQQAIGVAPSSAPMLALVHATFASTAHATGALDRAREASQAAIDLDRGL
jgi:eukaryotic-like serine/threonine-protein kinase